MRRLFIVLIGIISLLFIFASPAFPPTNTYATGVCPGTEVPGAGNVCTCINGATPDADANCVCPSGNLAEDDGTCTTDPFGKVCSGAGASASACQTDGTKNPVSGKDGVLARVINIFSFVIGVASVIMILVGGFRYVVSGGSSESVKKAKDTVIYALIGIVVFLLSRGIITFVINKL